MNSSLFIFNYVVFDSDGNTVDCRSWLTNVLSRKEAILLAIQNKGFVQTELHSCHGFEQLGDVIFDARISHSFTMRNISYSNEGLSGNIQDESANAGLQSDETNSFVSDISSQNFAFHSTPSFTMSTLENITVMDESKQILQEAEQKAETIVSIDVAERKEYEGVILATPAQVRYIAQMAKFMTKTDASFFIDCMKGRRQGRIESKNNSKKVTTVNEVSSS